MGASVVKYYIGIFMCVFVLLSVFSPRSALSQQEQKKSCTECHSGLGDHQSELVQEWQGSVHAKNGIYCNGCHGGDPTLNDLEAMNPENGFKGKPKPEDIPKFCGECHAGVEEDYTSSLHGKALGKGGPQCVTCHGGHGIKVASLELINKKDCTRCHGFERAATIRDSLAATDEMITKLDQQTKYLHRLGIAVEDLSSELFDVRNTFHRLFHSVEVQKVHGHTDEIQSRLSEIRQRVSNIQETLARRKKAGAVVVCLLLLISALFFYVWHTYKKEETHRLR
jgi:nitrate/TMAO reductase-like tetraheme cytochrome c subunit